MQVHIYIRFNISTRQRKCIGHAPSEPFRQHDAKF